MDTQLFEARVRDTQLLCERSCTPRFLGFLTESEAAAANTILSKSGVRFCFSGGYEQAERTVLCCMPDWCDSPDFPVVALTFRFRREDVLSHRDFLGALMSLGITRESVGDILTEPGRAVIFLKEDLSGFISAQLEKVGNSGITVSEGFEEPLPQAGALVSCTDTVASARLDCIVGALCGFSRNEATEVILSGRVSINGAECEKITRTIAAGDKVTVRGKGRFLIESTDGHSKKGRIILRYNKYV